MTFDDFRSPMEYDMDGWSVDIDTVLFTVQEIYSLFE